MTQRFEFRARRIDGSRIAGGSAAHDDDAVMLGFRAGFLGGLTAKTEKRIEFAGTFQDRESVETTDVGFADEDLRHRHSAAPFDHLIATSRFGRDVDLCPLDTLRLQ